MCCAAMQARAHVRRGRGGELVHAAAANLPPSPPTHPPPPGVPPRLRRRVRAPPGADQRDGRLEPQIPPADLRCGRAARGGGALCLCARWRARLLQRRSRGAHARARGGATLCCPRGRALRAPDPGSCLGLDWEPPPACFFVGATMCNCNSAMAAGAGAAVWGWAGWALGACSWAANTRGSEGSRRQRRICAGRSWRRAWRRQHWRLRESAALPTWTARAVLPTAYRRAEAAGKPVLTSIQHSYTPLTIRCVPQWARWAGSWGRRGCGTYELGSC